MNEIFASKKVKTVRSKDEGLYDNMAREWFALALLNIYNFLTLGTVELGPRPS